MIRLENLHKSFGDLHVLKGIDLNIDKGEIVAIVGPSGSGKSTVLRCMNLLEEPTNGKIIFEGENITDKKVNIDKIRQNIGMVFQNFNLFPHMTVLDNITLAPTKIKKISKEQANKKAEILLDRVGLLDKKDAYPAQLSGGQKQRVSLAGVLGSDAEILLFDEPLANLDPASGSEIMQLINDIHEKTNKTIIIVEHRIEDVLEQPFDKVVIIDKGVVKGVGTPNEILKSDLLTNSGLREPLYVEAMKLAGCDVSSEDNLRDINSINEENKEILKSWFKNETSSKTINKEEKILEIKNLTFSHDGVKNTLDDVSFYLNKGEILAVLGNNGAGKSTLCRSITGILKPKSGSIFLNNECIDSWSIKKKGSAIGYVMQNPNQMISQHMIKDEIALGLKCRNFDKKYILLQKLLPFLLTTIVIFLFYS